MASSVSLQRRGEVLLQLLAGVDTSGKPVLEKVEAFSLDKPDYFELIKSPLFIRNLAAGDIFQVSHNVPGTFSVIQRSGNLCVRLFRKGGTADLELELSPEIEKLGGQLDRSMEGALVYSVHVNIGFAPIESLLNGFVGDYPDLIWYYGNVYDPGDGVTPLDWWHEFIGQV